MADNRGVEIAFVFVYGGLMRGCDLHSYMAGAAFVDEGWTDGTLVVLDRYPGLVEGDGKVLGEIYKLADNTAMLEALDDLEDFNPGDPDASTYQRQLRQVHANDGSVVDAWTYVYHRDVAGLQVVSDGDWRKYCHSGAW